MDDILRTEERDEAVYKACVVAAIQEGLADCAAGRWISDDELGRRMDAFFDDLEKEISGGSVEQAGRTRYRGDRSLHRS